MHIEALYEYCLAKKGTEDCFPFDEVTLVFKVMGKMFALTSTNSEDFTVNLKCDPEYAEELRASHEEIKPGYHMNKKHWNTVDFRGSLEDKQLMHLIDHSYELVVKSLPKAKREILLNQDS